VGVERRDADPLLYEAKKRISGSWAVGVERRRAFSLLYEARKRISGFWGEKVHLAVIAVGGRRSARAGRG